MHSDVMLWSNEWMTFPFREVEFNLMHVILYDLCYLFDLKLVKFLENMHEFPLCICKRHHPSKKSFSFVVTELDFFFHVVHVVKG